VRYQNRFTWFKKWVVERQIFSTLQRDSGLSKDTLQRTFYYFLARAPVTPILLHQATFLRIDATYFKRFCVVCYQEHHLNYTQLFRFSDAERYEEIKEDLENLLRLGLTITSITCDGHKATLKAIRKAMPQVIIQRCLVHLQRMCLIWLTQRPKTPAAQQLRQIILQLHKIETANDRLHWIRSLQQWHLVFKDYLKEKTVNPETGRYWFTHRLIRRCHYIINRALPDMFHYLDNPLIPKTTNGIESYFGHLKNHLDLHRGLTVEHRISFIKWYIYFKNASHDKFSKPLNSWNNKLNEEGSQ
jgi:transposase-like protein